MRKPASLWTVVLFITLLFLLWPGSAALAHTGLAIAYPGPGAIVEEAPVELRLGFTEEIATGSHVTLYADGFEEIEGLVSEIHPDSPKRLFVTVPPLDPGTYTVNWHAVAADGHTAQGSYSFTITGPVISEGSGQVAYMPTVIAVLSGGLILGIIILGATRMLKWPNMDR